APIIADPRSTIRWCSIFLNKPPNRTGSLASIELPSHGKPITTSTAPPSGYLKQIVTWISR
ncbi:hypothetical protein ACLOJK_022650, partial [Asimina triloba]